MAGVLWSARPNPLTPFSSHAGGERAPSGHSRQDHPGRAGQRCSGLPRRPACMYGALRRSAADLGLAARSRRSRHGWPGVRRRCRGSALELRRPKRLLRIRRHRPAAAERTLPEWFNANINETYRSNIIGAGWTCRDPDLLALPQHGIRRRLLDSVPIYNYRTNQWGKQAMTINVPLLYSYGALSYDALGSNYATYNDLPAVSYDSPPVDGQYHCPCGIQGRILYSPHGHAGSFVDQNRRLRGRDRQHVPEARDPALSVHRSLRARIPAIRSTGLQHPGGNRDLCDQLLPRHAGRYADAGHARQRRAAVRISGVRRTGTPS